MDTNPENPLSYVKTAYIDKDGSRLKNGRLNIKCFHFTLDDNDKLDDDYIQSIKDATPSGVFYDRDVLGLWVNAEGVIYREFNASKHIIDKPLNPIIRYLAGVDWGYSHKGSIVVLGMDIFSNVYVIEEYTKDFQLIDFWIKKAKEFNKKYGTLKFYCDSARPEHIFAFQKEGLQALNGNKKVMAGIETVSKLFVANKLYFIKSGVMELPKQISNYVWDKNGEPLKVEDDSPDALRYGVYSDYIMTPNAYKKIII